MSEARSAWDVAGTERRGEVQRKAWKTALTEAAGNITAAAKAIDVSYATASRLNKKFGLIEYAAELRIAAGAVAAGGERKGVVTGRPRK